MRGRVRDIDPQRGLARQAPTVPRIRGPLGVEQPAVIIIVQNRLTARDRVGAFPDSFIPAAADPVELEPRVLERNRDHARAPDPLAHNIELHPHGFVDIERGRQLVQQVPRINDRTSQALDHGLKFRTRPMIRDREPGVVSRAPHDGTTTTEIFSSEQAGFS